MRIYSHYDSEKGSTNYKISQQAFPRFAAKQHVNAFHLLAEIAGLFDKYLETFRDRPDIFNNNQFMVY